MMELNAKLALGFNNPKESITIFKGDTDKYEEWFQLSNARYSTKFGWYVVGSEEVQYPLPEGVVPIELKWELVGDGISLKSDSAIQSAIDRLLYGENNSEFVGEIGQRITFPATLIKVSCFDGKYGKSYIYTFIDEFSNQYIWNTQSKVLEEGLVCNLTGTIKDYNIYHNINQTVLTRCKLS